MAKICTLGSATQDIFIMTEGAQTMHLLIDPVTATAKSPTLQAQRAETHNGGKQQAGTLVADERSPHERSFLLFEQGRKIDAPQLHYALGGGATNAAVTFKRLGHDVHTYINTAHDTAGDIVRHGLEKEGINLMLDPIESTAGTAQSFIFPTAHANHVVFCYRGVNKFLTPDFFPIDQLSSFKYLYFSSLSGQSRALLPFLAPKARAVGVSIASNPGMGQLSHEVDEFIIALRTIDILLVNAFEARTLLSALLTRSNCSVHEDDNSQQASHTVDDRTTGSSDKKSPPLLEIFMSFQEKNLTIIDYCRELFKHGPTTLIVTDGAHGVYVATRDALYFHPPVPTKLISALGAGDAFGSAFVSALAYDKDIETAIMYGVLNATAVLQSLDAQSGILTLTELETRVEKLEQGFLQKYSLATKKFS